MSAKKTKTELVYDFLLEQLISRQYHPGDRINISCVAKQVGVSEIPVREALRQLEGDGYVSITPNHGAVSIGIDSSVISQLIEVKGVLEGFASRLAVDYITYDLLNDLQNLNERMGKAIKEDDKKLFSQLNLEFHMQICRQCRNAELIKELENIWKRWSITKRVFYDRGMKLEESYEEHKTILKLIEDRDYSGVENTVRKHKFKTLTFWLMDPTV